MHIGIFAKTFVRPSLEKTLDAVVAHGIRSVQFNMSCAQLPSMPDSIEDSQSEAICDALRTRGIVMAAVSGTFNMIHPDHQVRDLGMRRLHVLARACKRLGTSIITLSTGTRDPESLWRRHPDNDSPGAWADLRTGMAEALHIAGQYQVSLAFEPEISNVIDTARKARRLLDEMRSTHLKVVIDAANLFHRGELPHMAGVLREAFDLLGDSVVLAHAKDLSADGEAGKEAAGNGLLNYDLYIELLDRIGYKGPLILHSLQESEVDPSVAFLRGKLNALECGPQKQRTPNADLRA
ncbi:MAG: sugar phosphate isomerase/epimerase [Candidatus Hydrogenedentes bacterium]|nr:sugar phosphate isomerase/epimerase [Candidatus Hydrogenedentota bacterium]